MNAIFSRTCTYGQSFLHFMSKIKCSLFWRQYWIAKKYPIYDFEIMITYFWFQSGFTLKPFKVYCCTTFPSPLSLQTRGPHDIVCSYKIEKQDFNYLLTRWQNCMKILGKCTLLSFSCWAVLSQYFFTALLQVCWHSFLLLRSQLDFPPLSHSATGSVMECGIFVLLIDTGWTDGFTFGYRGVHGHGFVVWLYWL